MKLFSFTQGSRKRQLFAGMFLGSSALLVSFLLVPPEQFFAGILPPDWNEPLSEVDEFFTITEEGNAVDRIKALFWENIVPIFKYLMVAVAMIYAVLYFMKMIVSSGNQEDIKGAEKNLLWEFLGFLIIAVSIDVAEAFDPFVNNGALVDKARIDDTQYRMVSYMQLMAGAIAIFYIFFAGFRMVTAGGEEEVINKQKNHIKWGFLGLMAVALSDVLVNRVFYPFEGQKGLGSEEIQVAFNEGTGLLKFFLTFTGILALVALVGSGVVYISSFGSEGGNEKAKKNVISSLIALAIIVTSYVLVATFIAPGQLQP